MTHLRLDLLLLTLILAAATVGLLVLVSARPISIVAVFACLLPVETIVLGALTGLGASFLVTPAAGVKEACAVTAIVVLLLSRRSVTRLVAIDYVMLLYCLVITFEAVLPIGGVPLGVRLLGYNQAMAPVALYALGRLLPLTSRHIVRLVPIVLVAASAVAVFALVERILVLNDFWRQIGVMTYIQNAAADPAATPQSYFYSYALGGLTRRAIGPYASPLVLAYSSILPAALIVAHGLRRQTVIRRSLLQVSAVLIGAAIVLSLTRAVILGFVAASLGSALFLGRFSGFVRISAVVGVVALVLIGPITRDATSTLSLSDPSANAHLLALETGLPVVLRHPLVGLGLGSGGFIGRVSIGGGLQGSVVGESFYLVLASEEGIPALALFLAVAIGIAAMAARPAADDDAPKRLLKEAVLIATLAFMFSSVTTEMWFSFQASALYWIFAGAAVALTARGIAPDRSVQ